MIEPTWRWYPNPQTKGIDAMLTKIRRNTLVLLPFLLVVGAGCLFNPDKKEVVEEEVREQILPNDQPENLIKNLQAIYNDKVFSAGERNVLYADLFSADNTSLPPFLFNFQPVDVEPGEEPSWGLDAELRAHENMFRALEDRNIHSLELTIEQRPPEPLEFPGPGQEDWVEILATNVFLRLMFNPQDGLLVDGGQAEFLLAPADGRWYLVDWKDLPRP